VEQRRIEDLPISGRQFTDFVLLSPITVVGNSQSAGTTGPFTTESVTKISFAGFSEQGSNLFLVDGADYTNTLTGFQRAIPSQEAVREFRTVGSSYSAEYGRMMGGVVNVITKSGTNELHGSVYEFLRNDALDAVSPLAPAGFHVLRQNQFGFTLGGAVVRDRAFFFGNYEGQRKAQSPFYSRFLLDNLEAINRTKQFYNLSEERLQQLRREDWDQMLIRVDVQGRRHFLTTRYHLYDQRFENISTAPGGFGAPSSFSRLPARDQSASATWTFLGSSAVTNEALVQYARRTLRETPNTGEPNLEIPNIISFGRQLTFPHFYRETRLQFTNKISYVFGRHSFKFGVDVNHLRDRVIQPVGVMGYVIFSPAGFLGVDPFREPTPFVFVIAMPLSLLDQARAGTLPPRPTNWRILFARREFLEASVIPPFNPTIFEAFGQDSWRATTKLTVDYGVRYTLQTRPIAGFVKGDHNNVQPRLGIAYAVNDRLVWRSGFGVFHSPLHFFSMLTNFVYSDGDRERLRQIIGPAAEGFSRITPKGIVIGPIPIPEFTIPAVNSYLRRGEYPSGILLESVFNHVIYNYPNPYGLQWGTQFEYQLAQDWAVTVGYIGTRGLKMTTYRNLNITPVGTLPTGKTRYTIRNPRFAFYHEIFPGNASHYHGGFVALQKRFSRNFSLNANYTFSKAIDLVQSGSVISFKDGPEDGFNLRLNRALSNLHVGQRLVTTFLAEAPQRTVLRGFKVGMILTAQSPRYSTLFAGFDVNGDLESGTDRVGRIGRNTYKGDRYVNVDLRVARDIRLSERVGMEVIAEFFNLFNRFNVTEVDTVYGAPDFIGPIPRAFRDGVPAPLPTFGQPLGAGISRQVQFALRVKF
jgi:hypothetical protein